MIRVLLCTQKPALQVEVKGAHNAYDPYTGKKLESAFLGSSYEMKPTTDGITWGGDFPGVYQLVIVPDSKESTVFVDGIQYSGAVAFYQIGNGLAAVNWLPIEEFTSCILSTNFAPQAKEHREALAALLIALRTLAYEQIMTPSNQFWDVRADMCGYKGLALVRLDVPYQEALHISKNIILAPVNESQPLSYQSFERVKEKIPYAQAVELAEAGKDATAILEKFMPNRELQSVTK